MPNNGRIIEWLAIEYNCTSGASISGTGSGDLSGSHSAEAYTQFAPNAINTAVGIDLTAGSVLHADGSGTWQVTYNGPGAPFGGYTVSGSTFLTSVSITAQVKNVKLYCKLTGSLFRLTWSAVDIYVNGVFNITLPGSSIDAVSAGVGQNYIPIIGVPLYFTGSCIATKENVTPWTYDPCNPGAGLSIEWSATASGSASGGWRFQQLDGNWVGLPAKAYIANPGSGSGCPFGLNPSDIVSATNTWGASIATESYSYSLFEYVGRDTGTVDVYASCMDDGGTVFVGNYPGRCYNLCTGALGDLYRDVYKQTSRSRGKGGTVQLVPNLTRAIDRLGDSYRALWYRFTFPQCLASTTRVCVDGVITSTTSNNVEVYPKVSEFLGCVGKDTHAIEDPFAKEIYCPTTAGKSQSEYISYSYHTTDTCVCPPTTLNLLDYCPSGGAWVCNAIFNTVHTPSSKSENAGYAFPSYVSPDEGGNQWHADDKFRYIATWSCPHWQFYFWREDWNADGSPQPWADYWGSIREQWLYNSWLPLVEKRRTRNSIILSPLQTEQGSTPWLDTFASGLRWIGISRFKTEGVDIQSSEQLTPTVHAEWNSRIKAGTPDITTIQFNSAGIELSGFNVPLPAVEMEFGSWTEAPFMLLYLAKRARLDWYSTNVVSMTISLVGYDGATTPFCTVPGTYDIGAGNQKKYAGSWGIDNGAGVLDDEGTDTLANGFSSSIMSDPEAAFDFELAKVRGYKSIRFEFEYAVASTPITIKYPYFDLYSEHPKVFWESGKTASLLWNNGVGVRWGQWTFFNPAIGFVYPPEVNGLGTQNTIIDWLGFKHRVLKGDGGSSLASTITTELSTLYDAYEGQSIAVVDKFSHGVLLPQGNTETVRGALVNSFSEVPPMSCFPFRTRDKNTWDATKDYAQIVYDMCEETRPLISPVSNSAFLTKPDDTPIGSAGTAPSGWYVWNYSPVLDNTEDGWKIKSGTKTYALLRPWHGFFCALALSSNAKSVSYDTSDSGRHYLAYVNEDGRVFVKVADNIIPFTWTEFDTGIDASAVCVRVDRRSKNQKLYLMYAKEDVIYVATSLDEGRSWSMAETIAPGEFPALLITRSGTRFYYWLDGTNIKGQVRSPMNEVLQATFTAISSVDADTGIAADESYSSKGESRVTLAYIEGGDVKTQTAKDGKTFS